MGLIYLCCITASCTITCKLIMMMFCGDHPRVGQVHVSVHTTASVLHETLDMLQLMELLSMDNSREECLPQTAVAKISAPILLRQSTAAKKHRNISTLSKEEVQLT